MVVDAAHNPAGAAAAAEGLREAFPGTRLVGVVGVMADKDVEGILTELEPVLDEVVVTAARGVRAMSADAVADVARGVFGEDRVHVRPDLADAVESAVALAGTGSGGDEVAAGVVVTGSIYLVAEARRMLGALAPDSSSLDTTSRGVSAVAEDTGARVLGELDDLDAELARELGGRDDELEDDRDDVWAPPADPHAAPEDSALLDDPWVVREEHDDYWDPDPDPDDGTDPGSDPGPVPGGGRA